MSSTSSSTTQDSVMFDSLVNLTLTTTVWNDISHAVTDTDFVTSDFLEILTSEAEASHKSYVMWQMGKWILLVYRPMCGLVGVVGNILTLAVVLNSSLRTSPTSVYMITLAVLDCILSCVGVLHVLPTDAALGEENVFTTTLRCRAFYFTLLFTAHWNTLTLMSMTGQRYVAIGFPLKAARWNTRRMAVITVVIAAVIAFIANWAHLFVYEALPFNGQYRSTCSVADDPGKFWVMRIYPWVDWTLYSFLPINAIVIFNLLIHRALAGANSLQGIKSVGGAGATMVNITHSGQSQTGQDHVRGGKRPPPDVSIAGDASMVMSPRSSFELTSNHPTGEATTNGTDDDRTRNGESHATDNGHSERRDSVTLSSILKYSKNVTSAGEMTSAMGNVEEAFSNIYTGDAHEHDGQSEGQSSKVLERIATITKSTHTNKKSSSAQVTRMLVCISVAFLFFTLPIGVFVVVAKHWNPVSGGERALFSLISVLSESLMYTNHSVNFLLYCLSGSRFRLQAAAILCRCLRSHQRLYKTEYSWA